MTPTERQQKLEQYRDAHALLVAALPRFPHEMWQFRAAPEEWTIHEILVHIADSEANSFVRCRRCIAEPGEAVMAYDERRWATALDYHARSPEEALDLFRWLRQSSYHLIRDLPDEAWSRTIFHPENGTMTLEDWLDTYARHVPEHLSQMEGVLQAWQQQAGAAAPREPERPSVASDPVITLREVTKETMWDVLDLKVRPEQERFVASNTVSITEAYFEPKAWFRAIYADEAPVGFVMLYDDPEQPEYFLWRFMIDAAHQGKGYGRRAIQRLIEHVRARPGARTLGVSYGMGEGSPEGFYRRLGFEPTGEMEDNEVVARLPL